MKALKSELAKALLKAKLLPAKDGTVISFEGKKYVVKTVPKAS